MTKDMLAAMREDEQRRMAAVPDVLVAQLGERMFDDAHENCGSDGEGCTGGGLAYYEEYARVLLADLLPEHERLIRERVAKETGTAVGSSFEGDPATCAEPGCTTQIDPVLDFQCGETSSDGEDRCGGYFCYEHIHSSPVDDGPCCSACLIVPTHLRTWSVPYPAYRPVDITPPELRPGAGLAASVAKGWAEPYTDPTHLPDLAARRADPLRPR